MGMPEILKQLNATQGPTISPQVKGLMDAVRGAGNPQALLTQLVRNNPQVSQLINQAGGDPQKAFYQLAQAKGVNPEEVLKLLR